MSVSSAQYAALLKRLDEFENDNRHLAYVASLRKEIADMNKDYFLEVAKGNIPGHTAVHKFGESPSGVQTTATDIWARADASVTQQIWLAPTAARIHTIASSSASDTTGGVGANSVIVSYLPSWSELETTETVTGNLNAGVAMANAAVMINRMVVVPQSTSTSTNVGTITATAATDATITAVILPGKGQTHQAIYGFPSIQTAYFVEWEGSIDKASGAAVTCDFSIMFNPNPDVQKTVFLNKYDVALQSTGSNVFQKTFPTRPSFSGPGIIKIQGTASAVDLDAETDFELILVQDGY
jgi:hypothetical protein